MKLTDKEKKNIISEFEKKFKVVHDDYCGDYFDYVNESDIIGFKDEYGHNCRESVKLPNEIYKKFIDIFDSLLASREEELCERVENMSYAGVLDSNERRRGYDIARAEFLDLIKNNEKE